MKIHDYTKRYKGHDYMFVSHDEGKTGSMTGWGLGIGENDYLFLENGNSHALYKVAGIKYEDDPKDMWDAKVIFIDLTNDNLHTFSKEEQAVFESFFGSE